MEFKNYCIVIMGNTEGILPEINKVSEKILGSMQANGKGIAIITFTSNAKVNELNDYFKECKRNFLLFILDRGVSAFNFLKEDIQNELFGNLEVDELKQMTQKLRNELANNKIDKNILQKNSLSDDDIKALSKEQRNEKMNEIFDRGLNNLNDIDRDILDKLTKFK